MKYATKSELEIQRSCKSIKKFTPAKQIVIQVTVETTLKHSLIEMLKREAYQSFNKKITKKFKELNDNLWSILAAQKELKNS